MYAHVRAANAAEAQKRVEKSLRACQLWTDECAHRVVAVPGDLAAPRLGLEPQWWDALAKGIAFVMLVIVFCIFCLIRVFIFDLWIFVFVFVGCLSSYLFYSHLAEVDAIVHNGAFVHWLLPYEKLKPTNVTGTQVCTLSFNLCLATNNKQQTHNAPQPRRLPL